MEKKIVVLVSDLVVLVADDDSRILPILVEAFEKRGFRCIGVSSPSEALIAIDQGSANCLLCDGRGWGAVIEKGTEKGLYVAIQTGSPASDFAKYRDVVVYEKPWILNTVIDDFIKRAIENFG